MRNASSQWAYRPRHGARFRRGTLVWAAAAVIRLIAIIVSLLAVFAGLTVGVGYVLVHHLAGLLAGH